jgi:hypothetical protein
MLPSEFNRMIHKIPPPLLLLAVAGILLAGPAILFAFLLGGPAVGLAAVLLFFLYFSALYILIMRRAR